MSHYKIKLVPQGVIPRDPNLKFVVPRAVTPSAPVECVVAFNRWLFAGLYRTGTWDEGSNTWTPSGLLNVSATKFSGDSSDLGSAIGGTPVFVADDLGPFADDFISPGLWIPQSSFVVTAVIDGEPCAHTAIAVGNQGEFGGGSFRVGGAATIIFEHPLDSNPDISWFRFRAFLDEAGGFNEGDPHWGDEFTLYVADQPE